MQQIQAERVRRVIGYVRASTQRQVESGLSLPAQGKQLEAECLRRGWELNRVTIERGASAKTMSRKGIAEALSAIRSGVADVLMVSKSDRATRNLRDLLDLMDWSAAEGWSFIDLEGMIDTSTPQGRANASMRGVFSELERRLIGMRTKDALAELREQGGGIIIGKSGKRIGRPSEYPPETLELVAELRRANKTLSQIAQHLNEAGVLTPGKSGHWHITTVVRAMSRIEGPLDASEGE